MANLAVMEESVNKDEINIGYARYRKLHEFIDKNDVTPAELAFVIGSGMADSGEWIIEFARLILVAMRVSRERQPSEMP